MKKKTALTIMHIAPSTVCYDAVAARDSNEVGLILAAVRKRNGYSLVTFSELLRLYHQPLNTIKSFYFLLH